MNTTEKWEDLPNILNNAYRVEIKGSMGFITWLMDDSKNFKIGKMFPSERKVLTEGRQISIYLDCIVNVVIRSDAVIVYLK